MIGKGKYYMGSESILTSVANEEIIPETPSNWTSERYYYYRFDFMNLSDCTIIINNGGKIFLPAGCGYSINENTPVIRSFKIVESGVSFHWSGAC